MRRLLVISTATLMLSSPAFATGAYVGAQVSVGDAPSQQKYDSSTYVSSRTYDVRAKGDRRDSREDVFDEALYKAANETLDENYEWFRIVDRSTDSETTQSRSNTGFSGRYERTPVRSCGLLGCTTRYETEYRGGVEYRAPEREETTYTVTLEFEMGRGDPPNSDKVYNARIVNNSYR